jgi:HAD superfamily hydrolase (TIGR01509 family)
VLALFTDGLEWLPGARELVAAVRAAGVPTALVTATRRVLVDAALLTLGPHNFDAVVCGDEVERAKPDPMPYLIAAATLEVDPRACVAIEDSPTGIASALAAGCTVLAVPHEVPLGQSDGFHVVSSLLNVDLPLLRSLIGDRI